MLHLVFGLIWIVVAAGLLIARQAAEGQVQNAGMLAAFAGVLAAYNFLRYGLTWLSRRPRDQPGDKDPPSRAPKGAG